jgi:hypothetical protein
LLIRLALWSLVLFGFRCCLGVNGPKYGPNFFELTASRDSDRGDAGPTQ